MNRRDTRFGLCSAVLLAIWAWPSLGMAIETGETVVDGSGRLFTVLSGAYGELFPGQPGEALDPVLALDLVRPDGESERLLVEGTAGSNVEKSSRLVYEDRSESLYVLWESGDATGSRSVRFVSLRGGEWSSVVEVSADSPLSGAPQMLLTRDSYPVYVDGGERVVERSVIHLGWIESGIQEGEAERAIYAPAILEDGEYIGRAPKIVLDDLDPFEATEPPTNAEPMLGSLSFQLGIDSRSVVATYPSFATGRLLTTEIRVIPGELASAASSLSRAIVDEGAEFIQPGNLEAVAGGIGSMIIENGFALHASMSYYLAAEVQAAISSGHFQGDNPGIVLENLADGIGSMIIEEGSRVILSGGLDREIIAERQSFLRIARRDASDDGATLPLHMGQPFHLIHFYVVANRPAPATGDDGLTYLSSGSGDHGLACWKTPGQLQYRETIDGGDGWTEVQSLSLGENLTLEQAEQVLLERVRRR